MGNYLNQPVIEKVTETGVQEQEGPDGLNLGFTFASVCMQGWRRTMEDTSLAEISLPQGESLFGIFDGHGGQEVSRFCKEKLTEILVSLPSYQQKDYEKALVESFTRLDELLRSEEGQDLIVQFNKDVVEEEKAKGNQEYVGGDVSDEKLRELVNNVGSTACVILLTMDEIICANVGDSRAVLTQDMSTYDLSDDHKPENEDEAMRIIDAGGSIDDGRVNGKLSLSRAIGDLAYKQNMEKGAENQMITCVPDVTRRPRSSKDTFLVIACDGIWDSFSSLETSKLIHEFQQLAKDEYGHETHADQQRLVVETLFDEILAEDVDQSYAGPGADNMSAILIDFHNGVQSTQIQITETTPNSVNSGNICVDFSDSSTP